MPSPCWDPHAQQTPLCHQLLGFYSSALSGVSWEGVKEAPEGLLCVLFSFIAAF